MAGTNEVKERSREVIVPYQLVDLTEVIKNAPPEVCVFASGREVVELTTSKLRKETARSHLKGRDAVGGV